MASFTNGVLAIKLNDGTMVSGRVTDATELECETADLTPTFHTDLRSDGGGNGDRGNGGDSGGSNGDHGNGDQGNGGEDQGDQGDQCDRGDQGDQNDGGMTCTTTTLTAGAIVREADLRISSTGAIWDKIDVNA